MSQRNSSFVFLLPSVFSPSVSFPLCVFLISPSSLWIFSSASHLTCCLCLHYVPFPLFCFVCNNGPFISLSIWQSCLRVYSLSARLFPFAFCMHRTPFATHCLPWLTPCFPLIFPSWFSTFLAFFHASRCPLFRLLLPPQDEPSSGMDPRTKRHLWKIISEEVKGKCAVVLTSHR